MTVFTHGHEKYNMNFGNLDPLIRPQVGETKVSPLSGVDCRPISSATVLASRTKLFNIFDRKAASMILMKLCSSTEGLSVAKLWE